MYVAREFIATAVDDIAVDFTCEQCGHHAVAQVIAIGTGASEAPFFIGQQAARQEASSEAAKALPAEARLAAGLAGCPGCGKPASAALRRGWLSAALRGLATLPGILVLMPALLVGLFGLSVGSPLLVAGAVAFFSLVLALLAWWQFRRLMRDVGARVSWREAP